jgi:hypothetical protein
MIILALGIAVLGFLLGILANIRLDEIERNERR